MTLSFRLDYRPPDQGAAGMDSERFQYPIADLQEIEELEGGGIADVAASLRYFYLEQMKGYRTMRADTLIIVYTQFTVVKNRQSLFHSSIVNHFMQIIIHPPPPFHWKS